MDILDDVGVSKLSAKVNYSFKAVTVNIMSIVGHPNKVLPNFLIKENSPGPLKANLMVYTTKLPR